MGKQFEFIMDKYDEEKFFEFVKNDAIVFFSKCAQNPKSIIELPEDEWFILYLYKEIFGDMKYKEIPGRYKYINPSDAPVIEYRSTIIRHNIKEIQRGRLWVEMRYYDDENLILKNGLLDDWYKELCKWIKKTLKCIEIPFGDKNKKEYVSQSLINLVENGYKLLG